MRNLTVGETAGDQAARGDLAVLRRVVWTGPCRTALSLTRLGVEHGFYGVGEPPPPAHYGRQVHGTRIVEATAKNTAPESDARTEADGLFTTTRGVCVAVKTADCLPILLVDEARRVALAVHAGWRGLTAGILGEAGLMLTARGIAAASLQAVIGPAIGRERFEVGDDVVWALHATTLGLTPTEAAFCTAKGLADRWHVDLATAAVFALVHAGLAPEHITVIQTCTYTDRRWNSFRRDGRGQGSNWSWVRL